MKKILVVASFVFSVVAIAKPTREHHLTLSAKSGENVEYCGTKESVQDTRKGKQGKADSNIEVVCKKGSLPTSDKSVDHKRAGNK